MLIDYSVIRESCKVAGIELPREGSRTLSLSELQSIFEGRTHFYDAGTLRFFGYRMKTARVLSAGLYIGTIGTQLSGFDGPRRYVAFLHRVDGEPMYGDTVYHSTRDKAERHLTRLHEACDDRAELLRMFERQEQRATEATCNARAAITSLTEG